MSTHQIPASPRPKESPRSAEKKSSRKSAKKLELERRNSRDTVASQLSGFTLEAPEGQAVVIAPVKLTKEQQKKLANRKKDLTVSDLTDDQIEAQKQELARLKIPPLEITSKNEDSHSLPHIPRSPRPAMSPHRRDEKKPASMHRVLPETPRQASPRSKAPREPRGFTPTWSEVSMATRVGSSSEQLPSGARLRLKYLDRKLSVKRGEVEGLKRQFEAAKDGLRLAQQKRDREAAHFQSARSAYPPDARDEERLDSDASAELDEIVGQLAQEDERRQH